jgi:hypothetical protein
MGQKFAHLIDGFVEQIRSAGIGPATDVALIFHLVDDEGNQVKILRISLLPTVRAQGSDQVATQAVASYMLVSAVIHNMRVVVLDPKVDGPLPSNSPSPPLFVQDITLEIVQP